MVDGEIEKPPYQIIVEKSKWIRAEHGGFMQFHIAPDDLVEKRQALVTNNTILGEEQATTLAPFHGVVMEMSCLPAISPGEPICNLGKLPKGVNPQQLKKMRAKQDGLEQQVLDDLGANVLVTPAS